jgi:hypothetical protein
MNKLLRRYLRHFACMPDGPCSAAQWVDKVGVNTATRFPHLLAVPARQTPPGMCWRCCGCGVCWWRAHASAQAGSGSHPANRHTNRVPFLINILRVKTPRAITGQHAGMCQSNGLITSSCRQVAGSTAAAAYWCEIDLRGGGVAHLQRRPEPVTRACHSSAYW